MKQNLLRLLVLSCVLLAAASASAAETISGKIIAAASGLPIAGVDLDVFDDTGASVVITGGPSDTFGNYTVVVPGPGTYRIRADPATAQPYATQYWSGVFLQSQATPLVVGTGAALTNINFALPAGVQLSGTISSNGVPLDAIDIDVYASNGEFLSSYPGTSQPDGTYAVGALPPGTYFVRADPDSTLDTQLYADAFYGGSMSIALATPIAVGAANLTGIDIALVPGGTIGGTVRDLMTAQPLPGLDLDLYDALGNRISVSGTTAIDGTYQVDAVPSGSYLLRVDPTIAQGYARTYYTTSATERGATAIIVTGGSRRTAIDFSIDLGGTLSGTIRAASNNAPLVDIDLDLFDSLGQLMSGYTARSDATGAYQLGPLQAGTYFIRADPSVLQGYAEQYYAGQADIGTATAVAVVGGLDTGGVDFSLLPAGAISGSIRDQALTPLAGIDLDLFDSATGMRLRKGATTAANGTFLIQSLTPGSYFVRADPTAAQGYAQLYYNASVTRSGAQPVVVNGGATSTGVLFVLPAAATITGRVTTPQGSPLAGVDMDMYLVQGASFTRLDQGATTDALGNYTISVVPPGDYVVRVQPDPIVSPPVYYGGTTDRLQATVLSPTAGQTLSAIDIVVTPLATTTTTMPAQLCGDATGDGFLTATDALFALRAAVGLVSCPLCACDVDGSGGIVPTDALVILKKSTGLQIPVSCPIC